MDKSKPSTPAEPPAAAPPEVFEPRAQRMKWIRFGVVFAVWLVADIATKDWADATLATHAHPQPIRIRPDEAGKTLGEVLKARYDWSDAEVAAALSTSVERLAPAGAYTGDAKVFHRDGPAQGVQAFYVFWRDDPEAAPRRFERNDQSRAAFWLGLAFPGADRAEVSRVAYETVAEETFATWLPELFRKLSPEDVSALASGGRIHPIKPGGDALSASEVVAVGADYLVTDHQIPVMGSWFKFVYAENPGAAFGFMKGVSPDIRQILFMLLAIVAFGVILVIVKRLPPVGWLVTVSFAGILAGAAGNFIDRIRFGYVIDFIDMTFGTFHWPTYNVADIAISLGVVALILDLSFNKKSLLISKKERERAEAKKRQRAAAA
ncbi:MAG: signal peptidase II [Deltaproteobacteria bacterium]|nr:signal peptidase II [Deltaproteobacteria bacterium]